MRLRALAALSPVVLGVALPAIAAGGVYLEEELVKSAVSGPPTRSLARTWLVEGKSRKEQDPGGSVTIVRADLGVYRVLDPGRRTYFEIAHDRLARVGEAGMSALVGSDDPAEWLRRTGNRRRIGDWEAYELRMEDRPIPGARLSLWMSPDVHIDRRLRHGLDVGGDSGSPVAAMLRWLRDQEGYPVEVVLEARVAAQIFELRQTLIKVEDVDVPEERFEIPPGYVRVPSPLDAGAAPAGGE